MGAAADWVGRRPTPMAERTTRGAAPFCPKRSICPVEPPCPIHPVRPIRPVHLVRPDNPFVRSGRPPVRGRRPSPAKADVSARCRTSGRGAASATARHTRRRATLRHAEVAAAPFVSSCRSDRHGTVEGRLRSFVTQGRTDMVHPLADSPSGQHEEGRAPRRTPQFLRPHEKRGPVFRCRF